MIWSRLVCLGLVALMLVATNTVRAEPQRVLLLHSFGRDFAPYNTLSGVVRTELASQSPGPVDFFDVSLESARFREAVQEGPLVDYMLALFSRHRLDLVIPIGGPAAQFAQRHRQKLFPDVPVLLAGVDQRLVEQTALTTNDAVVAVRNEPARMIESILQLLPQTTNIVVTIGASSLERFWLNEIREECQRLTNRVNMVYWNELSFAEMRKRCAALPPRSVIFYPLLFVDSDGVPHLEARALAQLHEVANAPLFGLHDSQLGQGIVGGPLMGIEELGRNVAEVARRILQGEHPGDLRIPVQRPGAPQFDGRELRRWGIRETQLPVGSVVRYRQPTFWELYRWLIIGVLLVGTFEAALIVSLLINRAKRRKGEEVATLIADLSSTFINLLPGEVDRAIENAQKRVCECLGLDVSTLWQWAPEQPDNLRMTHVYRRLPGPATPEQFDAREHFPWALEQLKAGRVVALSTDHVPAEAIHDQEVWRHFGLKTVLHLPLTVGSGPAMGLVAFNDTRANRKWTNLLVQRLRLVAQIFGNALARKHADKELRASEERFRSIALNLPGVVYQYYVCDNGQRGMHYVAGRAKEVFGVDPEPLDTFPERFSACVAPEDRQQWSDSVENAVAAVCLWEGEARFLKPTGEEMYVRGISQPERGEGQIVFSGVLQDVTEQKRLDLALARSERRYRKLHESVRDAFVSVDMTGLVQDFNSIFRQMLGYTDEELRRQTYLDLTPERWHTFEAGIVRDQVLARGYSEVYEKEYRRKDGTVFPVELRAYLIRDESDRPVAMWAIVRDVTERKRTEAALREFSARLIRTQEEERARLARELHDDITQRLAHLAIEIGRAKEVAPAPSWAEAGSSVREELIRLSEDVHALSYRLHPSILEDLGLAAAVQAEAEHLERQGPVPIEVKVHNLPDPISSEVAVCAFRIAQEALRNAIRHAHARTLTVSLFGSDGGVQLGVQDDGCGFDTGQQRHRFSLGLASMRERAHLLGGELDVDSAPGQGTTITVWIPLQQTPRAEG